MPTTEKIQTVIIGAGQAGLSVGYHLARRGLPFVILEANARVGDTWRNRWDSLRLFSAARWDGLAGMPFPAPPLSFPTKDEMGDYLESYAARFRLPVRTGVTVDHLSKVEDSFLITAGDLRIEAQQVVVAMANYQRPRVPSFASQLDPDIVQLHSSQYRNVSQLQPGGVLVVGAGNSGAEIAAEAARHGRAVWLAGRDTGHLPFRIDALATQLVVIPLMFRVVFHWLLTVGTPLGRKVRPAVMRRGAPLIRLKPDELVALGVQRVPRLVGGRNGRPLLEDGRVLDATNVVWSTGFHPGLSWIDLPVFDADGEPSPR